MTNVLEFDEFRTTVERGGLPSVTFVDPLFGDLPAGAGAPPDNDDAPPADLADGQRFIGQIFTTLFTPNINKNWLRTMLIVVYDEHGGFYDHVPPPSDAPPLTGQSGGQLGPRVPAFVVSPWTPPGLVLKDTFDHTTIAATILRRFCSPHPPVMSPRVTAARDLRDALPLTTPHEKPRSTARPCRYRRHTDRFDPAHHPPPGATVPRAAHRRRVRRVPRRHHDDPRLHPTVMIRRPCSRIHGRYRPTHPAGPAQPRTAPKDSFARLRDCLDLSCVPESRTDSAPDAAAGGV